MLLHLIALTFFVKSAISENCPRFTVPNGNVRYDPVKATGKLNPGTEAELTCNRDFVTDGQTTTICHYSGNWKPKIGSCKGQDQNQDQNRCREMAKPTRGLVKYSQTAMQGQMYQEGTTAQHECPQGTVSSAGRNAQSECRNGAWSVTFNTCDAVAADTCGPHPAVPNARLKYVQGTNEDYARGTTVEIICDSGYEVSGNPLSLCNINNVWTAIGECKSTSARGTGQNAELCPNINVEDGTVHYDLFRPKAPGTYALLLCNIGHLPSGSTSVTCGNDGRWTGTLGTCGHVFSGTYTGRKCRDVQITNGLVFHDLLKPRQPNTVSHRLCHLGYLPQGASSATCKEDGTWSEQFGACTPVLG